MRNAGPREQWKIAPLSEEPAAVFSAQDTPDIHLNGPSLCALPSGRLVISVDQYGAGVVNLPGKKGKNPHFKNWLQGRLFTSNDQGKSWEGRHNYPFAHARLFRDANTLYVMGDAGSVQIAKSSDGGNTWSAPEDLTAKLAGGDSFVMAPTAVLFAQDHLYVAAMKIMDFRQKNGFGSVHAAVILRAPAGSNLMNAKKWDVLEPAVAFRDLLPEAGLDHFGVPFYRVPHPDRGESIAHRRWAEKMGWHDAHLVQINDPAHYWHDPKGRSFHLLAVADAHRSNLAVLAKITEDPEGKMSLGWETTPAGKKQVFLPLPGGNMKFHILYDEGSKLYWLVSNQMADSMTRADKLPGTREGLPCDEDRRLQLHFSKNLVDWSFAGLIYEARQPGEFCYDPCMAIRGNDLCVACLAGEAAPGAQHSATRIVLHTIPDFRDLAW